MAKSYRPWAPAQSYLLPPSPTEWLPEKHLAYFVLEVVDELVIGEIESVLQSKDHRGERAYPPRMMVALLLYAYSTGTFSSRKIARETYDDVAYRVIVAGAHPHFTTVNQFRLEHRHALAGLFKQILELCQKAGLVQLGHIAIDGSKVKANASKHKAMSHDRMQSTEEKLTKEIDALLAHADDVDAAEDVLHGVGKDIEDLPAELQRREGRRAKIQEAKAALEQEAAEARATELRAQAEGHRETAADPDLPARQRRTAATLAEKRDEQADDLAAERVDSPLHSDDDLPRHAPSAFRQPVSPAHGLHQRGQHAIGSGDEHNRGGQHQLQRTMRPLKIRQNKWRDVGRKHLVQHHTQFRPDHLCRRRRSKNGCRHQHDRENAKNRGIRARASHHQHVIADAACHRSSQMHQPASHTLFKKTI